MPHIQEAREDLDINVEITKENIVAVMNITKESKGTRP